MSNVNVNKIKNLNDNVTVDISADNKFSITATNSSVSGNIGIGSTTPSVAIDAGQKTDAVALPKGTTAQRPTAVAGMIRWNTTTGAAELYNGAEWIEVITDYIPSGSTILG
jgi:hypothetical protein